MKLYTLTIGVILAMLTACNKSNHQDHLKDNNSCDITASRNSNAAKVTITTGIWGTVSEMEGNCMPTIGPGSNCTHCPIQRKVKVYAYTLNHQANTAAPGGGFYSSFNTTFIKEVLADAEGFYQIDLPAGKYSVAIVENGLLYANAGDTHGGINPVEVVNGIITKLDMVMSYKASF